MRNKELLVKIKTGFNQVQQTGTKKQKGWTQAFLQILKNIGTEEGFKVYSSSLNETIESTKGGVEWLFDLCWSIEGKEKDDWKNHYKGLKLICECEWAQSIDAILYDFQKLAVGKAEIKIMIVQYADIDKFNEIIKFCKKSIDSKLFNDGSLYILVGSGNNIEDIRVEWKVLWGTIH